MRYKEGTRVYDTAEEASEDLSSRGYTVKITRVTDGADTAANVEKKGVSHLDGK